jgi:hypothetical protein
MVLPFYLVTQFGKTQLLDTIEQLVRAPQTQR